MNSNRLLILLAPGLIWMVVVEASDYDKWPPNPSYGDLRLRSDNLLMIYMGRENRTWGTFSGTITHKDHVEDTLCRQFGYAKGDLTFGYYRSGELQDYPVWISHVQCNSTYQHILRCDYTYTEADKPIAMHHDHTNDWHLSCSQEVRHSNAYVGQPSLIPPESVSTNYSTSVGVVAFLEEPREWRFIVKDENDFDNTAHTACRAMGYTTADWNLMTKVHDHKDDFLTNMVELSASTVDCSGSFQCLSYCKFGSPKVDFSSDDAMIVKCLFELNKVDDNPGGYEDICNTESPIGGQDLVYATNNISSVYYTSTSEKRYSESEFLGSVISLTILLMGLFIAIVVYLLVKKKCNCKQKKPEVIPRQVSTSYGTSVSSTGGGGGHGDNGGGL